MRDYAEQDGVRSAPRCVHGAAPRICYNDAGHGAQVAEVLSRFPGIAEANVYGVQALRAGRLGCFATSLHIERVPQYSIL